MALDKGDTEEFKQLRKKNSSIIPNPDQEAVCLKDKGGIFYWIFLFCFQAWKVSWLVSAVGLGSKFSLPLIF